MNICFVSYEYPPETFDGVGTYTRTLAQALAARGHRVDVVTFTAKEPHQYEEAGVTVHRIKPISVPVLWRAGRIIPFKILQYSIAVADKLEDLMHRKPMELIEGPEIRAEMLWFLLWRKKDFGPKVVVKLHTPSYLVQHFNFQNVSLQEHVMAYLERQTVRKADYITAPSSELKRKIQADYHLVDHEITVIPNPVDTSFFRPAESFGSEKMVKVLYAGRIERIKGVETLVHAIPAILEKAPHCQFTLMGQDTNSGTGKKSLRAELQEYLHSQGVVSQAKFHERVEREDLLKIYQQHDIVVVPSLYESLGYVCLEAMACGKAVVSSGAGGMKEYIHHEKNALSFTPGCPEMLAERVIALAKNWDLRERLGGAARQTVFQKYSIARVAEQTVRFYQTIVKRREADDESERFSHGNSTNW